MTLKVLLVDDEPLARARMKTLLADCTQPAAEVTGEAAESAHALALMRTGHYDVALLDIHMPGLSGVALAHALRTFPHPPAIVFVTAHAEHAAAAFDLDAADYLTKPVRLERLQKALQKAAAQHPSGRGALPGDDPDVLMIQERNRVLRLQASEILYIRSELKYLTVRTLTQSYLADGSLSDLEQRWGPRFVRTHRSVLVARRAMQALERAIDSSQGEAWMLRIAGIDELMPVSRRQLTQVRHALSQP
ncbi:DNA-binding response regulator [Comamonas serinivorans]|uniref:DNA-binding response regulator n=1 Tax=Comamonas serinivorans TaxID=1082851 RepID=A0A1Y0ENP0_9BURK|nr:LytTR family DNA-binding domain-containing protein [Comamonas serinivorans]ARU05255.1 DNA-binding response regulator [Comamonas serinivorans]